jgi:hypothetical protein
MKSLTRKVIDEIFPLTPHSYNKLINLNLRILPHDVHTLRESILFFGSVVGLEWSNDSENYAGSRIAIGMVCPAGQGTKGYPNLPGWA